MHCVSRSGLLVFLLGSTTIISASQSLLPQSQTPSPQQQTSQQIVEKAIPSVAMLLAASAPTRTAEAIGTALVVRESGVLLTAYHVVRNANVLQVRFKSGEIFDQVQLLGVDARRDVAAIRISAGNLPVLAVAGGSSAKQGDSVATISHPEALPWSVSTGVVSAYRLADEVPGAGSGYRVIQFTAPISPGSSGGVLIDGQGRALGLIVASVSGGQNLNFAVPVESVMGLADAAVSRSFSNGSMLELPKLVARPVPVPPVAAAPSAVPEQTTPGSGSSAQSVVDEVYSSKDREFILRNFKTMCVNAEKANFFGNEQMKAALLRNQGFEALKIRIIESCGAADTVLIVGYTFAWDYPFELQHTGSMATLIADKGSGPFSGPAGAASVANKLVNALKPWRIPPAPRK